MGHQFFEAVDNYICDLVAVEYVVLKATVPSIETSGIPQISISASQGEFSAGGNIEGRKLNNVTIACYKIYY